MKHLRNIFILFGLASIMVGCGRPTQSRPGQWFENATGLQLPATVNELNAQVVVVLMVGDTYYLELKAHPDLDALLAEEFTECRWYDAKPHMVPPEGWVKELPFWDRDAVANASSFYTRRHTGKNGTVFLSYVAYAREHAVCYFVGLQTRG